MFDVVGKDISLLSDEDLRDLIGRLCEADLCGNNLSPLAVTYGGDQNAPDGGIDVHVNAATAIPSACDIPRSNTGYQVKAEKMPPNKICAEMQPHGSLRASIQDLADCSGAYIIVCSKDSVSHTALSNRKRAMHDSVASLANAHSLVLDFYDQNRIATWVRRYPSIVAWVRERIDRAISGWRPYGDWSSSGEDNDSAYLADDTLRIQGPEPQDQDLSALQGMERIRKLLQTEQKAVRLVGLSGTGKTRLAQALFDRSIGQESLAPYLAIYTDISYSPNPQPEALVTDLTAQGCRQILVVDNCSRDLHNRLTTICQKSGSRLSLLTIEFDIRDDLPENTDVFELRPSSDDLIEKLLLQRLPSLSQVNSQSIATFSGGNSRVALALGKTVRPGESVATLRDAELFDRLFQQRNKSDDSLLRSAQACALPYSFQGEDASDRPEAELSKLAALIGKDVRSLHSDIAELQRRGLIQQRGPWRALLPHAIANRLAATALENILAGDLERLFATASPRLLTSLSRRLGFLHTSPAAQTIVRAWLAENGRLGIVESLNDTNMAMLANVAPVAPEAVLDAIERGVRRQQSLGRYLRGENLRLLLLSIAFDKELFDRAVALILLLIEFEEPGRFANQVRNSFPSLFHLYLSGTHATVEQRTQVIDALLRSNSKTRREIGLASLEAMLQSSFFSSLHRFDFGGRPRDYGYFPKTQEEVWTWFRAVLALCSAHDHREDAISSKIREILSQHLRSLWTNVKLFDEVGDLCIEFNNRHHWPEGWRGIRSIQRFRQEPLPEDEQARLNTIEQTMAPKSLEERVRTRVLCNVHAFDDDIDSSNYEAQFARRDRELIALGITLVEDSQTFVKLLPELVACQTRIALCPLAKGIIDCACDRRVLWNRIVACYLQAAPAARSIELMACYLFNLQTVDAALVETLLQDTFVHPALYEWFPVLQIRVSISAEGISRLKAALSSKKIPAERFRGLAYNNSLDDYTILVMMPLILALKDGFPVALDTIWCRLPHNPNQPKTPSPELLAAGRLIAESSEFKRGYGRDLHSLGEVIIACCSCPEGIPTVERLLARLLANRYGFIDEDTILGALIVAQPVVVLNTLFAAETDSSNGNLFALRGHYDLNGSPFNRVPHNIFLLWCNEDPAIRYPLAASIVLAFGHNAQSNERHWTDIALVLLEHAPDHINVLKQYIDQLYPMSWGGSRAAAWEANVRLLDTYATHPNAELAAFARSEYQRLKLEIDKMKQEEMAQMRIQNERFE